MNLEHFRVLLRHLYEIASERADYVPVLAWGETGVGKSATVQAVASDLGLDFIDLRLGQQEIGDLERVARIVKLLGFVNSAPGFSEQPKVIDGASGLLISLFGDRGRHARSAVGVAELPFNIAVEVEMVVQVA